jgi:hypothetical protein
MSACKKRHAQLFLEQAHLPAERWLGDAEPLGGSRQGAQFRDLDEVAEALEVCDCGAPLL